MSRALVAKPLRPWFGLAACGLFAAALGGCSPPPPPPWRVVTTDPTGWMLAVAATADRVITAGGQPGSGPGMPGQGVVTVVRGTAAATVTRLPSPQPGMLWWVHALPGGAVWFAGENGSVVRYDESQLDPKTQNPELRAIPTSTTATLYGIWALSDEDVWAVGGDDGQPGVILHGGRSGLTVDTTAPTVASLFKVFAADPEHLFVVGSGGVALRRSGGGWTRDPTPTTDRLLTVWGTGPADVFAVGGLGDAQALHWDGGRWSALTTLGLEALAGLTVAQSEVLATGQRGLVATRPQNSDADAAWQRAETPTTLDLHAAAAVDAARFAVGGNLSQYRLQPPQGVLLQRGGPERQAAN